MLRLKFVKRLSKRCNAMGAAMVEYGLVVALISVVAIVALTSIGQGVSATFGAAKDAVCSVDVPDPAAGAGATKKACT